MPETFTDRVPVFSPEEGLNLQDGSIDELAGIIRGVSIATAGVEAIGHGEYSESGELVREFWTDTDTLETMLQACLEVGEPVKAKLEHGTGLTETVGTFDNFRIDGDHLRADFTAFPTSAAKDHLFALAGRIAKQFGVSVSAILSKAKSGAVDLMRCREILSIDFVDEPAINAALFSRKNKVDSKAKLSQQRIQETDTSIQNTNTITMDDETKEAIGEMIAAALAPVMDELSALKGDMMNPEDMAEKVKELMKPEELEEGDKENDMAKESDMKALKDQITDLSAKLDSVQKESRELGTDLKAKRSDDAKGGDKEPTFESELNAKIEKGTPRHIAFNELCNERKDLVDLEAKKQGKQIWQLI